MRTSGAEQEPAASGVDGPGIRLTVLSVPGCPNVALLEERLAEIVGGNTAVAIARRELASEDDAVRWGMHGSPTLLVNGVDPFAVPGQPASLSCRRYPHGDGPADGAPSAEQIRLAIAEAFRRGG